jgi:thiol-disulfide isomerase/thioredoxin
MKKAIGLLLALSMLLTLSACGQSAPSAPTAGPETPVPAETPASAAAPTPTEAPAVTEPDDVPPEEGEPEEPAEATGLVFSTTDRDGKVWDESALRDYSLIMLNFWEPWCPPCVGEMPELEELWQTYADRGFLILGIYSTPGVEDEVDAVLADCGTSYPILHYCAAFDEFQTGYVPTTVFLNGEGELVGHTEIGARSLERWSGIVEDLL